MMNITRWRPPEWRPFATEGGAAMRWTKEGAAVVAGWRESRCALWAAQRARTGRWLGDAEIVRVLENASEARP